VHGEELYPRPSARRSRGKVGGEHSRAVVVVNFENQKKTCSRVRSGKGQMMKNGGRRGKKRGRRWGVMYGGGRRAAWQLQQQKEKRATTKNPRVLGVGGEWGGGGGEQGGGSVKENNSGLHGKRWGGGGVRGAVGGGEKKKKTPCLQGVQKDLKCSSTLAVGLVVMGNRLLLIRGRGHVVNENQNY